jgi:hypothetical protein
VLETWRNLREFLPTEEVQDRWGLRKEEEIVDILITNEEDGLEWIGELRRKLLSNELYVIHRDETRRRAERVRTREEWWVDPGRTYHRYVKPIPHPQCAAKHNDVMRHFAGVLSPADLLTTQFRAAGQGEKLYMEGIQREAQAIVAETWKQTGKNENLLKQIVRTRNNLSAIGLDGISYQVFKLGGDNAVKWMMQVFTKIIGEKKVPDIWKQARTVMLYKKGDVTVAANYRPISTTCCLYRIFTALIAKYIQATNRQYGRKIFSTEQKGFIEGCNGCCEHSIFLNELFAHTHRKHKGIIACQIDFTNAFGSVPQEMIYAHMEQLGPPAELTAIVKEFYTGASSVITLPSGNTQPIPWNMGTKQGCPLSPVLFNLCIEPLMRELVRQKERLGYEIETGGRTFYVSALAYADDLVLVTDTEEKLEEMLRILEEFCRYAHMAVNAKKCCVISSVIDQKDGRRKALERSFGYRGEELPGLNHEQAATYLGSPVGGSRKERAKPAMDRPAAMRDDLVKVCNSDLVNVQKLQALRQFRMPMIDFLMFSGDAIAGSLRKFDQTVHGTIADWIGGKGIPEPFFHMSWRDGGLGIASLKERQDTLLIRAMT